MQKTVRTSRLLPAAVAAAGLLVLSSCAAPPRAPSYDDYVSRWINDSEVNLVQSWGIPSDSYGLEGGGRVVEYTEESSDTVTCATRFTIDNGGRVAKYWYRGSDCSPPAEAT